MKRKIKIIWLSLFLIMSMTFIILLQINRKTIDQNETQYKGISTTIQNNITRHDIEINLNKMQNINASVALCAMEYINTPTDNTVKSISNWKSTMDTFMNIANEKNIKVQMLKPHIGTYNEGDNFNRARFNPRDKEAFFKNWLTILLRYADYCNVHHIPILAIECEMSQLTNGKYYNDWKQIVETLRNKYPNLKLTTAFRYSDLQREIRSDKKDNNSILNLTDYVGVNLYLILQRKKAEISTENMNTINEAYKLWNKKILITESGATPWSNFSNNEIFPIYIPKDKKTPYDFIDQHTVLNAILSYALNNKKIAGVFLWHTNKPFNFLANKENYNLVKKYYSKNYNPQ